MSRRIAVLEQAEQRDLRGRSVFVFSSIRTVLDLAYPHGRSTPLQDGQLNFPANNSASQTSVSPDTIRTTVPLGISWGPSRNLLRRIERVLFIWTPKLAPKQTTTQLYKPTKPQSASMTLQMPFRINESVAQHMVTSFIILGYPVDRKTQLKVARVQCSPPSFVLHKEWGPPIHLPTIEVSNPSQAGTPN